MFKYKYFQALIYNVGFRSWQSVYFLLHFLPNFLTVLCLAMLYSYFFHLLREF
jgi:hypothetical protein